MNDIIVECMIDGAKVLSEFLSESIVGKIALMNSEKNVKNMAMEHYLKNEKFRNNISFMRECSMNENTTINTIEKHLNLKWQWDAVSLNPNINLEFIGRHMDKHWNWFFVSKNPNITMEMIEHNMQNPWDWGGISRNPNLTIEMVKKYRKRNWNMYEVSAHKNITMDMVTHKSI